ncbi:MAG: hypothetical protein Q4B26_14695 [Eubacteriales bacterium]|nr:hypothetical protein [Eubacteriales bacterium]
MNRCKICGSKDVRIYIEGEGAYCLSCHNTRMLSRMRIADEFHYPEFIYIMDDEQELHQFQLEHLILGTIVQWHANETDSHRSVTVIADVSESAGKGLNALLRKAADVVSCRTIEKIKKTRPLSNLLEREDGYYALKAKGNMRIVTTNGGVHFEIDGELFTPEETAKMLEGYDTFQVQYQISDASEDILRKNEILVPEAVGKEVLLDELEILSLDHSDERMRIAGTEALEFAIGFSSIERKLHLMIRFGDQDMRDEAEQIKELIIRQLRDLSFESEELRAELIERTRRAIEIW